MIYKVSCCLVFFYFSSSFIVLLISSEKNNLKGNQSEGSISDVMKRVSKCLSCQ